MDFECDARGLSARWQQPSAFVAFPRRNTMETTGQDFITFQLTCTKCRRCEASHYLQYRPSLFCQWFSMFSFNIEFAIHLFIRGILATLFLQKRDTFESEDVQRSLVPRAALQRLTLLSCLEFIWRSESI